MTKPVLVLNRPIQVGFTVLDLSKYLMFDFHYNTWLTNFPKSTLLFTDTDSLAYEVVDDDLYASMVKFQDSFDFSEYPKDHPLFCTDNMKVIGKFKDECLGQLLLKFVGLRPKLYSLDYERIAHFEINEKGEDVEVKNPSVNSFKRIVCDNKNTAKGIRESVAKEFTFQDYEQSLRSLDPNRVEVRRIGSDLHNVYSIKNVKIALSAFDTKRWICDDGIKTLAFGHLQLNMCLIIDINIQNCFFLLNVILQSLPHHKLREQWESKRTMGAKKWRRTGIIILK